MYRDAVLCQSRRAWFSSGKKAQPPSESISGEDVSPQHDKSCNSVAAYGWGTPEGHGTNLQNCAESPYCCPFPTNTNVLTEIWKLWIAKAVFDIKTDAGSNDGYPMLWPEQRSNSLMGFITRKFTKGGDIVLDLFMSTRASAKACLLEPRYRIITGFDKDRKVIVRTTLSFLHVSSEQTFNPKSDVRESEEV